MIKGRISYAAWYAALLGLVVFVLSACDSGPAPAVPSPTAAAATPEATVALSPGDVATAAAGGLDGLSTPTSVPTPSGLTDADAANIYAAVIDSLLGEKVPPVVYISPYVGQGERLDDPDESRPLPDSILAALPASSGTRYELAQFDKVIGPLDSGGVVNDGGVFITLGAIAADPADASKVTMRASLYRKVGDAVGDSFHLQRDAAASYGWKVLDTTQEWADS